MKFLKVLTLTAYYYPAFKAGGPVKSIKNMVDHLGDKIKFLIVTSDRDLGDLSQFSSINIGGWDDVGLAKVKYIKKSNYSIFDLYSLYKKSDFDVLYMNSFFDFFFTIRTLLLRRFSLLKACPIVIAPRGEFSSGALSLKFFKKNIYIRFSRLIGLYDNVIWQASSELEKRDILEALGVDPSCVFVANNLPEKISSDKVKDSYQYNDKFSLVFLSRISPKKNLYFALQTLKNVQRQLDFDIYGPIEDKVYWKSCLHLIDTMPKNIRIKYQGVITPEHVSTVLSKYDLFFFPTLGENYGHVIAE
ncbi:MAG: glycosyltransferase family 4 protein, partial [Methyloprofundus sp.]|nr:glycosyltransferase family 4 protein [Methyloprofundus sp.]